MNRATSRIAALAVAFALAVSAAACSDGSATEIPRAGSTPDFPAVVVADNGEVTVDSPPERIVSLSTVATEILFAIGAGDQVIAVDSQSNHPPEAPITDLQAYTPNIEAIAELRPDLVLSSFDPGELVSGLDTLGIPVILFGTATSLDHAYEQISQTGLATGRSGEASELVSSMRSAIEAAVDSAPAFDDPPTVYHEVSFDLWSATSDTFIGQLYELFGLVNIADGADETGGGFPQLSAEYVLDADPDLIFLGDVLYGESIETVAARPGWADLSAVRNGAVIELDTDVASRWGPRVPQLVEAIAEALRSYDQATGS